MPVSRFAGQQRLFIPLTLPLLFPMYRSDMGKRLTIALFGGSGVGVAFLLAAEHFELVQAHDIRARGRQIAG